MIAKLRALYNWVFVVLFFLRLAIGWFVASSYETLAVSHRCYRTRRNRQQNR
jgi:hypothetical protein